MRVQAHTLSCDIHNRVFRWGSSFPFSKGVLGGGDRSKGVGPTQMEAEVEAGGGRGSEWVTECDRV